MTTKAKKVTKTSTRKKGSTNTKTRKAPSKAKVQKTVDSANEAHTVKQVVESRRDIKYNYPQSCKEPLERKSFRQKARNKLRTFERQMTKLKGKKLTELRKEYNAYKKEVLFV